MEPGTRKTLARSTLAVVVLLQRNCNALREAVGSPSIEAWAKSIGIGYGSLHRLLTGSDAPSGPDRPPNLDTIVRVAEKHKIEPWKLLHPQFDPTTDGFIGEPAAAPIGRPRIPKTMRNDPESGPDSQPKLSRRPKARA